MRIKLSEWAKNNGLSYRTAYRYFKSEIIKGEQLPSGTILIEEETGELRERKTVIYCRESSSENKAALNNQVHRLTSYCNALGWKVNKVVKEIGSGLNDKRPKFLSILNDKTVDRIVVEHSDRFSRFGVEPIKQLLSLSNRELVIVNQSSSDKEDLIQDFVSVITSFCARIYGQRRTKKATEKLIKELDDSL